MQALISSRSKLLPAVASATIAATAVAGCGSTVTTPAVTPAPAPVATVAPPVTTPVITTKGVSFTATPNPLPAAGPVTGTTTIRWKSHLPGTIIIRVSADGTPPKILAEGRGSGSATASFIVASDQYTFTLYDAATPTKVVASLNVSRR